MNDLDATSHTVTIAAVRKVLAADYACSESAFLQDGLVVTPAEVRDGQRRFQRPAKLLTIATMGNGVVISCHPERMAWVSSLMGGRSRDDVFSAASIVALAHAIAADGQELQGPIIRCVCTRERLRVVAPPPDVTIALVTGEDVRDLYRHAGFSNALSYRWDTSRPDACATVAVRSGAVVGIAAASADCETLWQIGIDVVPSARGEGIGRSLVGRLTAAVCKAGRVPYYSTAISNVRSIALATGIGYWPLWTELYARDHPASSTIPGMLPPPA